MYKQSFSANKSQLLFDLQEIALNTEDSSTLLNYLIPQVFERINSLGLNYEFILSLSFNAENQISQVCAVPILGGPINLDFLAQAFPYFEK